METKSVLVGVVITLLVVAGIGGTVYVAAQNNIIGGNDAPENSTDSPDNSAERTAQTVTKEQAPDAVKDSIAGAKALKANLSESETFADANVSISQEGEVVVHYTSQADNGPALKEEMGDIAVRYAAVVGTHNETGGLTVAANGVKLMVSSDAAEAHDDGKINREAFEQTFHWSTYETDSENQ